MEIYLILILGIFVSRIRATVVESKTSLLTKGEIASIVKAHNDRRSKVQPSGSDILALTWDSELADQAQAYSEKCIFRHSAKYIHEPHGFIGENIYITTRPMRKTDDIVWSVTAWYNEHVDYDYGRNYCKPGKMCGHYTQLVWNTSNKVGCGKAKCQGKVRVGADMFVKPTLVVCKYGPSGNVKPLFSNKARRPYKKGSWCSECPEEASLCEGNLCTAKLLNNVTTTTDSTKTSPSVNTAIERRTTTRYKNWSSGKPDTQNKTSGMPGLLTIQSGRPTPPAFGPLRCRICDGELTTEECTKLNQSKVCSESERKSMTDTGEPWYCAKLKENDQVKMSCMKQNECNRLVAADAEIKCCDEDLCNIASVPVYNFLILMLSTTFSSLNIFFINLFL